MMFAAKIGDNPTTVLQKYREEIEASIDRHVKEIEEAETTIVDLKAKVKRLGELNATVTEQINKMITDQLKSGND